MENSIEFFLNTHLEWSLSHQDLVITGYLRGCPCCCGCCGCCWHNMSYGGGGGGEGKGDDSYSDSVSDS